MAEFHAVDAGQGDVDARPGDQTVAIHDAAVGYDEMGGPPIEERPDRKPPDEDEPDRRDDAEDDVLGVLLPSERVDVAGDERRRSGRDDQDECRDRESPPVRVAMQDHMFVLGEHILRVAHGSTVLGN